MDLLEVLLRIERKLDRLIEALERDETVDVTTIADLEGGSLTQERDQNEPL